MQMTFEVWADKWYANQKNEVKPNTLREYEKVKAHLSTEFLGLTMQDITPKRVQELLDAMHAEGRAKSTINKRKYMIQQIFRYATVQGLELANPCSFVKAPRLSAKSARRALTSGEIATVTLFRNREPCGLYAFCLLYTGLRRSEMLALTWEDIDLSRQQIHVHKVINFIRNRPTVEYLLKNGNKERFIPIPRILYDELLPRSIGKNGFVFVNSAMQLPNETEHARNWNRYREQARMNVTQHMFRHTYATMLFNAKVDIKTAAYLLGHNDERTTLAIYTHLEKERATRGAVQQLDNYISAAGLMQK